MNDTEFLVQLSGEIWDNCSIEIVKEVLYVTIEKNHDTSKSLDDWLSFRGEYRVTEIEIIAIIERGLFSN